MNRTGLPQLAFGDELSEALIPVANRLVQAVHATDRDQVAASFAAALRESGEQHLPDTVTRVANRLRTLEHLVVVLAAMVVEDHPAEQLLGWTLDPERYGQLRDDGVPALLASIRCLRGRADVAQRGDV